LARSWAIAGGSGFRAGHIEQWPIDFVHRDERCGHAGGGLEKPAAVEALLAAELVGHREQPCLDFALPLVLRVRIKFVARHDLRRDGRLIRTQFGRHQCGKFCIGQLVAHDFFLPGSCPPRLSPSVGRPED
jgi:hypothetical protein